MRFLTSPFIGAKSFLLPLAALIWFFSSFGIAGWISIELRREISVLFIVLPIFIALLAYFRKVSGVQFWILGFLGIVLVGVFFVFGAIEATNESADLFAVFAFAFGYSLLFALLARSNSEAPQSESQDIWEVVSGFQDRRIFPAVLELTREARRMRLVSYIALSLIGVLIFVAGLVFLFAGSITSLDLRSENLVSSIDREYQEVKTTVSSLQQEIISLIETASDAKQLQSECDKPLEMRDPALVTGESGIAPGVETRVEALVRRLGLTCNNVLTVLVQSEERDKVARMELARQSLRLEKLQTDLDKARQDVFLDRSSNSEVAPLVASAVTRFGVVIILMFFVQSLSNLYRYTLRLSSLYKSRAIALLMMDEDTSRLEKANKLLSVETVAYGREPATVSEEVKKIIDVVGKHFSASKPKDQSAKT